MAAKQESHTAALEELKGLEVKARQAQRQADAKALEARNKAEQAEGEAIKAHAGDGDLKAAEKALDAAEAEARNAGLAAKGAALRVEQAQTAIRHYHAQHAHDLIAEAAPDANAPAARMLEGVNLILHGDAEWKAQAQAIGQHLIAAGQRPNENMRENHELHEVARVLRRFEGKISPPLPHGQGMAIAAQEEANARTWKAERNQSPQAA